MLRQGVECLKYYGGRMFNKFLRDERGEVNMVAIVVLMGVAVLVAVVFKDAIVQLLGNIMNAVNTEAKNAVTTKPNTTINLP